MYQDLSPLDSEGLNKSAPTWQVKWTELTNVIFHKGRLRPRPGLQYPSIKYGRYANVVAVDPGPTIAVMELINPGTAAARTVGGSYKFIKDTLRPDGSSTVVAGWTGNHLDVDETPPDNGGVTSSTEGAKIRFTWDNVDGALNFDGIDCVVFKGRARNATPGQVSVLVFSIAGDADTEKTVEVYASVDQETNIWQDFTVIYPLNYISADSSYVPWTETTVNAMALDMELSLALSETREIIPPDGDGNYLEWLDASVGGAASYTDFNSITEDFYRQLNIDGATIKNGASGLVGEEQSWTYTGISNTMNSISNINIKCLFKKPLLTEPTYTIWFETGGTRYTLLSSQLLGTGPGGDGSRGEWRTVTASAETNPATEAAWTNAAISGGEFGITVDSSGFRIYAQQLEIEGLMSSDSAKVDVTWLAADVYGWDSDAIGQASGVSDAGPTHLYSTTDAHFQWDSDELVRDITNSVAMAGPGHVPLDWDILYGQVYLVDGTSATRYFPDGSSPNTWAALTANNADGATALTGRTVAAFADRILYGWTNDNGSIVPERVAYSKEFDGSTHQDATTGSAGDFDLLDTSGGVLLLKPLSEDICGAYKETGIYALRRTGNNIAPIIRDVIDFETQLIAPLSVKNVTSTTGQPVQIFLGFNPSTGYNIFTFDGSQVVAIGDPIHDAIKEDSNLNVLRNAFGEIDPEGNHYWLFFAEGDSVFPDSGYTLNLRNGAWTRFTLSEPVSSAGIWTISTRTYDDTNGVERVAPSIAGRKSLCVGTANGQVKKLDYNFVNDVQYTEHFSVTPTYYHLFTVQKPEGNSVAGRKVTFLTPTITTGDLRLGESPGHQTINTKIHIYYYDTYLFNVDVSVSVDGGANWTDAQSYTLGGDADGSYKRDVLDLDMIQGHRARFRLQFTRDDTDKGDDEFFEIGEILLEFEGAGEAP